jgi:hypothetical protein
MVIPIPTNVPIVIPTMKPLIYHLLMSGMSEATFTQYTPFDIVLFLTGSLRFFSGARVRPQRGKGFNLPEVFKNVHE